MMGVSIIDLTLTTMDIGLLANWAVEKDDQATTSDHAIITWEMEKTDMAETTQQARSRLITGWDIKALVDEEHEDEKEQEPEPLPRELAQEEWGRQTKDRPLMTDTSGRAEVEAEAAWIGKDDDGDPEHTCKTTPGMRQVKALVEQRHKGSQGRDWQDKEEDEKRTSKQGSSVRH
jgi:hypothetical protein